MYVCMYVYMYVCIFSEFNEYKKIIKQEAMTVYVENNPIKKDSHNLFIYM